MFEERYRKAMERVRVAPSLLDQIKEQDAERTYRLWEQKRKKRVRILAWSATGATAVAGFVLLLAALPNGLGQKLAAPEADALSAQELVAEAEWEPEEECITEAEEAETELSEDTDMELRHPSALGVSAGSYAPKDYRELYDELASRYSDGDREDASDRTLFLNGDGEFLVGAAEREISADAPQRIESDVPEPDAETAGGKNDLHGNQSIGVEIEADLVLTDGSCFYCMKRSSKTIWIVSGADGVFLETDRMELSERDGSQNEALEEMFLYGDTLYVLLSRSDEKASVCGSSTVVLALDVSDRTDLRERAVFYQDGIYAASRMEDGQLWVVSGMRSDRMFELCDPEDPVGLSPNVDGSPLLPEQILICDTGRGTYYTVVTSIDAEHCVRTDSKYAILGAKLRLLGE